MEDSAPSALTGELENIGRSIRETLSLKNIARDSALTQSRTLIRLCANTIRAIHREDSEQAQELLEQLDQLE